MSDEYRFDMMQNAESRGQALLRIYELALSRIAAESWQTSEIADHKDFIYLQSIAREAIDSACALSKYYE